MFRKIKSLCSVTINKICNFRVSIPSIKADLIGLLRNLSLKVSYPSLNKYYSFLSVDDLQKKKDSDTLIVFGCGYSINGLTEKDIEVFKKYDTLSFNYFFYQNLIDIKFHLMRELVPNCEDLPILKERIRDVEESLQKKFYKKTTYLLQNDLKAYISQEFLQRSTLPFGAEIFKFKTYSRVSYKLPPEDLSKGVCHTGGTLSDCISFGYSMGYKRIIFAGVDLNDRRYFWLNEDETHVDEQQRGGKCTDLHNTAPGLFKVFKNWLPHFKNEGIELFTYNPNSLLTEIIPTISRDEL